MSYSCTLKGKPSFAPKLTPFRDWDPQIKRWHIGQSFTMTASFKDRCTCCEYRQEIRGEMKGRWSPTDPWDVQVVPLAYGALLDATIWKEDGNKTGAPFGHRKGYKNAGDDEYNPSRDTGCSYSGSDRPSMAVRELQYYDVHLEFRGRIVDTCGGEEERTVYERIWQVIVNGRAPLHP